MTQHAMHRREAADEPRGPPPPPCRGLLQKRALTPHPPHHHCLRVSSRHISHPQLLSRAEERPRHCKHRRFQRGLQGDSGHSSCEQRQLVWGVRLSVSAARQLLGFPRPWGLSGGLTGRAPPHPHPTPAHRAVTGPQGLLNWNAMEAAPPTSNITEEAKSM